MSIDREVYSLIKEAVGDRPILDETVYEGVQTYCKDNGMEQVFSKYDDKDMRGQILKAFLEPIVQMPREKIALYFRTYPLRAEFKLLSNKIRNEALKKYRDNKYLSASKESLEQKLGEMSLLIYRDNDLKTMLSDELADCQLELDYLLERTDSLSLRMRRLIEVN